MQAATIAKKPRKQAISGRFRAGRIYRGRIKDDHKIDQGHGTEAVLAMVNYAIDHLGLKRVFLRTNPQNARAIRVYLRFFP